MREREREKFMARETFTYSVFILFYYSILYPLTSMLRGDLKTMKG